MAFSSLSVVVLAFNEVENLRPVHEELEEFLRAEVDEWEIILIDDGSTDGTGVLVDELAGRAGTVAAHHETNGGMGAGLKTGYGLARYDWVTFLPADGQIDPESLRRYFPETAQHDLVTGRYEARGDGPLRWMLSRGLRALTWGLTGSRIRNEAPYLFRRGLWGRFPVESDSFFFNLEFVIRCERAGVPATTVMSWVRPRRSGASKVAATRRVLWVFSELLALRRRL